MEVSAHAIYLDKLEGVVFKNIIFTNLTEDHLDFFNTMEKYYDAKRKIFTKKYTKNALINIDDGYGERLKESINVPSFTYSINKDSDFKSKDCGLRDYKQIISFNNQKIISGFIGKFNIYNLTAALACLKILNFQIANLQNSVNSLKPVAGRFNQIVIKNKLNNYKIIGKVVDFDGTYLQIDNKRYAKHDELELYDHFGENND